jgi:hypothetical protein
MSRTGSLLARKRCQKGVVLTLLAVNLDGALRCFSVRRARNWYRRLSYALNRCCACVVWTAQIGSYVVGLFLDRHKIPSTQDRMQA